ncbi:hypothetical protein [Chitinophaga pinensis]|uniref:Uncharacterized protein n=1 Tax=Chitinophaga pinensis TaxID=79329 RepID=A0A5C6LVQ2_9BACT|nr:hypothetical protein [Chitinophaga pinensis]TWW00668.1 hypothetical protein FEF09_09200 [Chitinophaga pinensis]
MTLDLFQYFQLLSLLVAVICYKGLSHCRLLLFIPLLLLTNIVEIVGTNYRMLGWTRSDFIYNWYILLSTPMNLYLYGIMLRLRQNEKPIYIIISLLSILFIFINFFFLQGQGQFNNISVILIEILNIVFSCFVLLRLALHGDTQLGMFKDPYSWISAANLLFGLITLVLLGLQQYIRSNNIVIGNTSLYRAILPVVNIILYSSYCVAFVLCRIRINRLLLSSSQ